MKGLIGFGIAWAGYLLLYFGVTQLSKNGPHYGLVQLATSKPTSAGG